MTAGSDDQPAVRQQRQAEGREPSASRASAGEPAEQVSYIRLTQQFAEIANRAESIEEGVSEALDCFCRALGWPLGHAYLAAGSRSEHYVDSGIWWVADGVKAGPFVAASATTTIESGEGFVGQVIATREPRWVKEGLASLVDRRCQAAREVGVECGLAFPVLVQDRVAGVLEFFSHDLQVCEGELLDAVSHLGTQLGRVIERVEFERDLARLTQEERRRIGRELHDTLSQQLTGIGMLARSLQRKLEDQDHAQAERSRALVESIREAREQLRAIAHGLNPVDVDAENLGHVMAQFVAETEAAFGVPCKYLGGEDLDIRDDFTANQLFRIVREAVHNAAKHAKAKIITVEMSTGPSQTFELRVRDNGSGFDVASLDRAGMGLRTLRYRGRLIGGRLRVESEPGQGTSVVCTLRGRGDS